MIPIFTSTVEFVCLLLNLHSIYLTLLRLIRNPCVSKACLHISNFSFNSYLKSPTQ
ncbi:hypothetical protein Lalb_Chr16g0387711 [Lupinus albus]|uniref:Uncharacterized protein n=1 Tax=Lupinus albus TaxID=3870 RepID=A0A6A4PBR5_LUPAL|nr:hypothetical protein Lalb_Chr16g0387711 [Lupinus albus]